MKVKDLMTADSLKHCTPETKLTNVAKIMKEINSGALPVVDKDHKVIGLITDRDVCLSLVTNQGKNLSEVSVKEILTPSKIHSIKAEDTITDALREMRKNKIGRLLVTDKEGKLKGLISVNNLLSHALTKKEKIGAISSGEENLAKTIKTLSDRDNSNQTKKKSKEFELEPSDE